MSSTMNIVCAADERFAMPLAVTLCSAAANSSLPMRAFVLNTDLSDRSKRAIESACSHVDRPPTIQWVDADKNYMRDQPVGLQHLSQATYLRLGMGRMIPADVDRVIYLDSDVLVVKDLKPLWEMDLHGKVVGAVRDFMTPLAGASNALGYCIADCRIASDHVMFNAGILLMELKQYRDQQVEAQCVAFLQKYRDQVQSADQDALNAVLADRHELLDFQWNVQMGAWNNFKQHPSLSDAERNRVREVDPSILHFSGAGKPWNSGLRSGYCQMYVDKVNQTRWYGTAGFRYWQAKRLASCVRTIAVNRFASFVSSRNRRAKMDLRLQGQTT
jgi:lipopolysaccharide biosynthesis glycosyltransferase